MPVYIVFTCTETDASDINKHVKVQYFHVNLAVCPQCKYTCSQNNVLKIQLMFII